MFILPGKQINYISNTKCWRYRDDFLDLGVCVRARDVCMPRECLPTLLDATLGCLRVVLKARCFSSWCCCTIVACL